MMLSSNERPSTRAQVYLLQRDDEHALNDLQQAIQIANDTGDSKVLRQVCVCTKLAL
jgi:hypothetical protein